MPESSPVFLDTSGWIALLNADDRFHAAANERMRQFGADRRPLVTTDWVLAETGNGLARFPARSRFAEAVEGFRRSKNTRLVRIDDSLFQRAVQLYANVDDKTWGLIDCASFVVMRDAAIPEALTTDHHFTQAGFRTLLAED
jgi:predicted nucleic acid-binding protein